MTRLSQKWVLIRPGHFQRVEIPALQPVELVDCDRTQSQAVPVYEWHPNAHSNLVAPGGGLALPLERVLAQSLPTGLRFGLPRPVDQPELRKQLIFLRSIHQVDCSAYPARLPPCSQQSRAQPFHRVYLAVMDFGGRWHFEQYRR